jgi:hypothetical protein
MKVWQIGSIVIDLQRGIPLTGGVHIAAMSLVVMYPVWFSYIACLSQWEGRGSVLYTGGISYAFCISLLISKLFCRNTLRTAGGGGVKTLRTASLPLPLQMPLGGPGN